MDKPPAVAFIPHKIHLRFLYEALKNRARVIALVPPDRVVADGEGLEGVAIRYWEFGFGWLARCISPDTRTLKYIPRFSQILKKIQSDAMIVFECYHWYTLQSLSYKKRHPECKLFLVNETKRWPQNRFSRTLKRCFFWYVGRNISLIDGIFVYTEAAQSFLHEQLPQAKRVHLLPVPTDMKLFVPPPVRQVSEGGELRLLVNARYASYKRHVDLFEAITSLVTSGRRVRLTCIGRAEKGKEQIVELANQLGLADIVSFRDAVPPELMPAVYHEHDVLVLPSYNEAIGMVVPEAMACGLPTITTDTVGANVYVADGETGFIYPTGNVTALTQCIERFFDKQTLETFGANACKRMVRLFNPEMIASRFLEQVLTSVSQKEKEQQS